MLDSFTCTNELKMMLKLLALAGELLSISKLFIATVFCLPKMNCLCDGSSINLCLLFRSFQSKIKKMLFVKA